MLGVFICEIGLNGQVELNANLQKIIATDCRIVETEVRNCKLPLNARLGDLIHPTEIFRSSEKCYPDSSGCLTAAKA